MCMCLSLCTTDVIGGVGRGAIIYCSTLYNGLPSYPPDKHHSSDAVIGGVGESGGECIKIGQGCKTPIFCGRLQNMTVHFDSVHTVKI